MELKYPYITQVLGMRLCLVVPCDGAYAGGEHLILFRDLALQFTAMYAVTNEQSITEQPIFRPSVSRAGNYW